MASLTPGAIRVVPLLADLHSEVHELAHQDGHEPHVLAVT